MSASMNKEIRQCLAIASIIIGGTAVAIPDITWSKALMAFATSLNAAALYLLKEENPNAGSQEQESSETSSGSKGAI